MVPNRSPRQYGQNTAFQFSFWPSFGQFMAVLDHMIIYYYLFTIYLYYYYIHYYYLWIIPPRVCHHRGAWFMQVTVTCPHIPTIPSTVSAVRGQFLLGAPSRGSVFICGVSFTIMVHHVSFSGVGGINPYTIETSSELISPSK
jgi:hypothetical protein